MSGKLPPSGKGKAGQVDLNQQLIIIIQDLFPNNEAFLANLQTEVKAKLRLGVRLIDFCSDLGQKKTKSFNLVRHMCKMYWLMLILI